MNWFKKLFRHEPKGPLSGNWEGFYIQDGTKHRIEAALQHRRTLLTGTMIDLDVETEVPLRQIMNRNEWTQQQTSDFEKEIRGMLPEAINEPIFFRTVLPTTSLLSGTVADTEIHITKTYLGEIHHAYLIGDYCIEGKHEPCHPIEYDGILHQNSSAFIGQWSIRCTDDHCGEPELLEVSDQFELRRK